MYDWFKKNMLAKNRIEIITEWIKNKTLWKAVKQENFNPELDRVMICGSEEMTYELKEIFEGLGSKEGSTKVQGGFVIEKAFAEK